MKTSRRSIFKKLALIPAAIVGISQKPQPLNTSTYVTNLVVKKEDLEKAIRQALVDAERRGQL